MTVGEDLAAEEEGEVGEDLDVAAKADGVTKAGMVAVTMAAATEAMEVLTLLVSAAKRLLSIILKHH